MAILRSIKFTTALAAFALFFMPWLDIQCSGKSLATQTGIQTITGGATPSEELGKREEDANEKPFGSAKMVAAALFATGLGMALLLVALLNSNPKLDLAGSALCGLALLFLLVQVSQGFPAKDEVIASVSADQASNEVDMSSSLAMAMAANIEVEVLPAFIISCVLLGIPVLLLVGMVLAKLGMEKPNET